MKRKLIFLPLLAMLATACNPFNIGTSTPSNTDGPAPEVSNTETNKPSEDNAPDKVVPVNRYMNCNQVNHNLPYEKMGELKTSFIYGDNYYYYFYLGDIENVLLQPLMDVPSIHYTGMNHGLTLKRAYSTTESIENTSSQTVERTTSAEIAEHTDYGYEIEVGGEGIPLKVKETVEVGFSASIGASQTNIFEDSISKVSSYTKEYEEEFSPVFGEDCPHGYYREIISGCLEIYACVVLNPITKKANVFNNEIVIAKSFEFDYSPMQSFKDHEKYTPMPFDVDLSKLEKPTKHYVPKDEEIDNSTALGKGFDSGKGTKEDPFIIGGGIADSATQFTKINGNLDYHYRLETDIDFKNYKSHPTQALVKGAFKGSLDLNGHTIKNLNMMTTYQTCYPAEDARFGSSYKVGLFEVVEGEIFNGTIDNFNFRYDPYHEGSDWYDFGFITGAGSVTGNIHDIKVQNSKIDINRGQSRIGTIAGQFAGSIANVNVVNCKINNNGDCGGIVGECNGFVDRCTVDSCRFNYYFAHEEERSTGGIAGVIRNGNGGKVAWVNECMVKNTHFEHQFPDVWFDAWDPKNGEIVGHAITGRVYNVGHENKTRHYTGDAGDWYYHFGWGWAGKMDDGFDVK